MKLSDLTPRMRADFLDAGISEGDIEFLSPYEVFARWLEWNGIVNWGITIWDAAAAMQKIGRP